MNPQYHNPSNDPNDKSHFDAQTATGTNTSSVTNASPSRRSDDHDLEEEKEDTVKYHHHHDMMENDDDDTEEEIFTLFLAYRAAHDEDVLNAQNAMSHVGNRTITATTSATAAATDDHHGTGSTTSDSVVMYTTTATSTATSSIVTPTANTTTHTLTYYIIPYHWFQMFYVQVMDAPTHPRVPTPTSSHKKKKPPRNWKEMIGPIPQLDQDGSTTAPPRPTPPPAFLNELQKKLRQQQQQPPMSEENESDDTTTIFHPVSSLTPESSVRNPPPPPWQHGRDYVLVGSNVWLLLSSKFGCHSTESYSCVCVPTVEHFQSSCGHHHHKHDPSDQNHDTPFAASSSRISVVVKIPLSGSTSSNSNTLYHVEYVPLPLTCRFPYEQYFPTPIMPLSPVDNNRTQNVHTADGDDHLDSNNNNSTISSPVILLPPSTTATADIVAMNPQDMDDDDDDHNNNSPVPNGPLNHIDYNSIRNKNTTNTGSDDDNNDALLCTGTTSSIPGSQFQHTILPSSSRHDNNALLVTIPVRRKYGSGLGNLGNTCFMNSTLQCLGHTLVLQYYFLSQQYQKDLNRNNPLGTGGELATQFAQLLSEMWTATTSIATSPPQHQPNLTEVLYTTASNVVYPKNFKYTLGKHAAQFMGYDQHDSQELATYLLDALHEDCNRITTKPYIEKPEQTLDETDQEASDKAWELHLQREDSHILEYFMGQVKSRVQCNQIECQRISTTFDPFMFLSVPIPGSEDRTIQVTFVPMDAHLRNVKLSIKMNKMSTIEDMIRKLIELLPEVYDKDQYETSSLCTPSLSVNDMIVCDVWKKEVFDFIQNKEDIEKIRDNDDTFVYQLAPLQMIRQQEAQLHDETFDATTNNDDEITTKYNFKEWKRNNPATNVTTTMTTTNGSSTSSKYRLHNLDVGTLTQLNRDQEWLRLFQDKYMKSPLILVNAYHAKKGSTEEKVRIYRRLAFFLDQLHQSICVADTSNDNHRYEYGVPKRVRGSLDYSSSSVNHSNDPTMKIQELIDCSESHKMFHNVQTMEDLAILEFISKKMYLDILHNERVMKSKQLQAFPNGIIIEVRIRTNTDYHSYTSTIPLVIRLSSNTTVYQFREMIAQRFVRCVKIRTTRKQAHANTDDAEPMASATTATSDAYWSTASDSNSKFAVTQAWDDVPRPENGDHSPDDMDLGPDTDPQVSATTDPLYEEALNIVCRIPLLYDRKTSTAPHNRSSASSRPFGSVNTGQQQQPQQRSYPQYLPSTSDYDRPAIQYAQRNHNEEKELIFEIVGNHGQVYVNIPSSYIQDESFDIDAIQAVDVYQPSASSALSRNSTGITVLDCIEKFCQKEQLEESEQWYCNRCQQHVCAWKQFHIYRCPPHLIVHLKRFQFSARTHRRQKINIHVDFPLTGLDLSKQVLHWNNDNEKPIYDCYAVSNHYGGLGGGHYTAYAVNDDGVWCHYDDSRITSHIIPSEVVSSAAYVLYYRRRDVPVDMEYIQKIVSSPQAIITQQQSYNSPYSVVDRDDIDDDVDPMEENRSLLHKNSAPRVVSSDTAVVPLLEEEEGDDNFDENDVNNSTNLDESATTMNHTNNLDAFPSRVRDDDDTVSHSSDDGLPLPSGLRVLSASASSMIVVAEDDDEDDNVNNTTTGYNRFSSDDGTDDFFDTATSTNPVVEHDDDDFDSIRVENDDVDDASPTTTTTTESSTRASSLPLQ